MVQRDLNRYLETVGHCELVQLFQVVDERILVGCQNLVLMVWGLQISRRWTRLIKSSDSELFLIFFNQLTNLYSNWLMDLHLILSLIFSIGPDSDEEACRDLSSGRSIASSQKLAHRRRLAFREYRPFHAFLSV